MSKDSSEKVFGSGDDEESECFPGEPFTLGETAVDLESWPLLQSDGELQSEKDKHWNKVIRISEGLSEASNIGIVIQIFSKWIHGLFTLFGGFFPVLVFIADPAIYFFKSLIRILRVVGREAFGVKFEEEKYGTHKWQTAGDVVSLILFSFTIVFFLGAIVSGPVGITVAWALAMCGLSVVAKFDYIYREQQAKANWEALKKDPLATAVLIKQAKNDYLFARNSKRFFIALIVCLTLLLVCGSAAVFAPPALAIILFVISKFASASLVGIAFARFGNWLWSGRNKKRAASEASTPRNGDDQEVEETTDTNSSATASPASPASSASSASSNDSLPALLFYDLVDEDALLLSQESSPLPKKTPDTWGCFGSLFREKDNSDTETTLPDTADSAVGCR